MVTWYRGIVTRRADDEFDVIYTDGSVHTHGFEWKTRSASEGFERHWHSPQVPRVSRWLPPKDIAKGYNLSLRGAKEAGVLLGGDVVTLCRVGADKKSKYRSSRPIERNAALEVRWEPREVPGTPGWYEIRVLRPGSEGSDPSIVVSSCGFYVSSKRDVLLPSDGAERKRVRPRPQPGGSNSHASPSGPAQKRRRRRCRAVAERRRRPHSLGSTQSTNLTPSQLTCAACVRGAHSAHTCGLRGNSARALTSNESRLREGDLIKVTWADEGSYLCYVTVRNGETFVVSADQTFEEKVPFDASVDDWEHVRPPAPKRENIGGSESSSKRPAASASRLQGVWRAHPVNDVTGLFEKSVALRERGGVVTGSCGHHNIRGWLVGSRLQFALLSRGRPIALVHCEITPECTALVSGEWTSTYLERHYPFKAVAVQDGPISEGKMRQL